MHAEANGFEGSERIRSTLIQGTEVSTGSSVRLRPAPGGDILDLALRGKTAVVESIEVDFEGRVYVAVSLDEDPGRDFGARGLPGHRFFFRAEEVEPLIPSGKELP